MELRRHYHHLHYISAIKGDKVVKIINVICGKPKLSIKKLDELSDAEGSIYASRPVSVPVVKRMLREASTSLTVKTELLEEVENGNDGHISDTGIFSDQDTDNHDLVDDTLGMTLKQLKEKHKPKKRKFSFNSSSDVAQNCQSMMQESGDSPPEDDDDDLHIALKSWKVRFCKGSKSMKRQKFAHVPQIIGSVKSEPMSYDHDYLLPFDMSGKHKNVGAKVSVDGLCSSLVSTSSPDCYPFGDNDADRVYNMEMTCQVLNTGDLSPQEGPSASLVVSEVCCPSEPAIATVDATLAPESSQDNEVSKSDDPTGGAAVTRQALDICDGFSKVDDFVVIKEETEVCSGNPGVSNMEMPCQVLKVGNLPTRERPSTSLITSKVCCPSESSIATIGATLAPDCCEAEEIFKSDYPTGSATVTSQTFDTGDVLSVEEDSVLTKEESGVCNGSSSVIIHTADLCVTPGNIESKEILEDDISMVNIQSILASAENDDYVNLLTCKESPTSILPLSVSSACDDSHINYSLGHGISAHGETSLEGLPGSVASACSVQHVKQGNHDDANQAMSGSMEHVVPCSFSGNIGELNIRYDTAAHTNKNSSLMSDNARCDESKKMSESVVTEAQGCSGLQRPPERLLLARKTISPTSQEKLRRAMKTVNVNDNLPTEKCTDDICIEVDNKNGVSLASSDSVDDLVITSPKRRKYVKAPAADMVHLADQRTKKGKGKKSSLPSKGTNKAFQPVMSSCKTIQQFSQSAITFSQQQMHDFDRLAGRLTNELSSLKELMVETLLHEGRSTTPVRCNMNEITVALENISKVEETAKKWLSIMNRDCNRFCKIMSLAEKEASTSTDSNKEIEETARDYSSTLNSTIKRKKITFADENGGRLCDVRVYDDVMLSPSNPPSASSIKFSES